MSELIQFSFETRPIRGATDNQGIPWFVAKDVAEILGYDQTANGLKHCKGASILDELNKNNNLAPATKWIKEADVYRMVMKSTLPDAERFQDWVAEEVLPSLRKTGSYTVGQAQPAVIPPLQQATELAPAMVKAAEAFGFTGNQATLSANKAILKFTGINLLEAMGTSLIAPEKEALLTPTDIANRLGIGSRAANPLLIERGLQTSYYDHSHRICYEPTEAGKPYAVFVDTGKKHKTDGAPIRHLRWNSGVLKLLPATAGSIPPPPPMNLLEDFT